MNRGLRASTWAPGPARWRPRPRPRDIVTRLNAELVKIMHSSEFRKKMEDIGADPVGNTPAQMAAQIKDDTERFARLVKDAKVTLE